MQRLMDDFSCALYRRILLQGRLYVFQRYVCFWANIFGSTITETIDLQNVTILRKAKTLKIVPNALEFRLIDGGTAFFTSFIYHDNAYRTILLQWQQYCRYGRIFMPESPSLRRSTTTYRNKDVASAAKAATEAVQEEEVDSVGSTTASATAEMLTDDASYEYDSKMVIEATDVESLGTDEQGNEAAVSHGFLQRQRAASMKGTDVEENMNVDVLSTLDVDDSTAALVSNQQCDEPLVSERYGDADTMPSSIPPDKHLEWPSDMDIILRETFKCGSLANFFSDLLSDGARGFERHFRERRGDSEVKISAWTRENGIGLLRDLGFRSPVQASFGPPSTYSQQTQFCRLYNTGELLLESSQRMTDIPYGDYFTVDTRMHATEQADGDVQVAIGSTARFSKNTVFKKQIQHSVAREANASAKIWLTEAQRYLSSKTHQSKTTSSAKKRKSANVRGSSPGANGKSPEPSIGTKSFSCASAPQTRRPSEASLSSSGDENEKNEEQDSGPQNSRGPSICQDVPSSWKSVVCDVLGVDPVSGQAATHSHTNGSCQEHGSSSTHSTGQEPTVQQQAEKRQIIESENVNDAAHSERSSQKGAILNKLARCGLVVCANHQ